MDFAYGEGQFLKHDITLTEQSYHSVSPSTDEQVAIVVERHTVDAHRHWGEGKRALCVCVRGMVVHVFTLHYTIILFTFCF